VGARAWRVSKYKRKGIVIKLNCMSSQQQPD
jgi:hypothetical protein